MGRAIVEKESTAIATHISSPWQLAWRAWLLVFGVYTTIGLKMWKSEKSEIEAGRLEVRICCAEFDLQLSECTRLHIELGRLAKLAMNLQSPLRCT